MSLKRTYIHSKRKHFSVPSSRGSLSRYDSEEVGGPVKELKVCYEHFHINQDFGYRLINFLSSSSGITSEIKCETCAILSLTKALKMTEFSMKVLRKENEEKHLNATGHLYAWSRNCRLAAKLIQILL